MIKSLLTVNPSARPSCDQILQMPVIKKMCQRIFKEDAFEEECQWTQAELLSTIRVPRNLLYLTDKLPKPSYESCSRRSQQKDSNSPPRERRTKETGGSLSVNMERDPRRGSSHPRAVTKSTAAAKKTTAQSIDEVSNE